MKTLFARWGSDLLAGVAVAALGVSMLVGTGGGAVAAISPSPNLIGLTCPSTDTGGCQNPNSACTMDNGGSGTCQSARNCPCKQ